MEEVWRKVEGIDFPYEVSNLGRVRNYETGHMRKLQNTVGYRYVTVKNDKKILVHRMVATAFIPNPEGKKEVNHIDGNRSNNNVNNLEWVTSSENTRHAVFETKHLAPWGNAPKAVKAINGQGTLEIEFKTVSDAEIFFNSRHISDVLKGKRKTVKGYHFEYLKGGDTNGTTCARKS